RFVVVLTEELGLGIRAGGSTTLRRRRLRRGLEPDRCWWIANEPAMRGKWDLDLRTDPPPDLAIESDVTSSSLDRMAVYACLGVPEVWGWEDGPPAFELLQANRTYPPTPTTLPFPIVTPADLVAHLNLATHAEENALVRQFRDWVRQRLTGGA